METAKVFWSGRSQAVRLPKEFRFDTGEVRIRRHGKAVILEPIADGWEWIEDIVGPVDDDFVRAVEDRPGADGGAGARILRVKFLLDTNALVAFFKGHPGFLMKLREHRPADVGIPAIVAHELFYGAFRSARVSENLRRVEGLQFEVLDFDPEDARRAGELRAYLAAAGTPIGPYDVLIAGQALARDLVLVTHNTREFQRIADLRIEDWQG